MSTRASAGRYARALLDVVIKEGNPEQVEKELATLAGLFAGDSELQKALANPAVPVAAKRKVVESVVARTKPSPPLGKLLLMLGFEQQGRHYYSWVQQQRAKLGA